MDSFKHTVPTGGYGQATTEQCWFASYKMMMTFLKRNTSEVEDKLKAAGIDVQDAKDNGLADTDYKKACEALGLKGWAGSSFNQEPGIIDSIIGGLTDGAEAFLKELVNGPLWVSRVSGKSYHVVVAVGYDDENSKIIYNNPYPGPTDAVELSMKANTFVRNITAASCSVQGKK
jgi:hypothetical protein